MGLESATFIDDLVATNPLGTDLEAQGDDHLRLIKAAIKATFIGFSRTFYCPSTTTAQTSTVTVALASQNKLIPVDCSGGAVTVNLPQGSTLADGYEVEVIKTDHSTNLVTIDGYSTETINGALTQTLWQSYQLATLRWSTSLSAWLMKRQYIPAKGEITPWTDASAVPEGWLFSNGQTIGDASSSGTARANADCLGLFTHLYGQFANGVCAVSGGRGVSAAADWAAHKNIGLPNLAGRTWVGLDNLGGISDAGLLSTTYAGTAGQTNGEAIGNESNTLTLAKLPSATLTTTVTDTTAGTIRTNNAGAGSDTTTAAAGATGTVNNNPTVTKTGSVTASTSLGGSNEPHANVQPSFVSAWKIKL